MNKQTKSKKQSNTSTNKVHLMFIIFNSWHKLSNAQYRFKNLSLRALITQLKLLAVLF